MMPTRSALRDDVALCLLQRCNPYQLALPQCCGDLPGAANELPVPVK